MPTIVTHAAVPLCLGLGLGNKVIPRGLLVAGIALAMLPDADVLAFKFGVAYGNVLVIADLPTRCCLPLSYRCWSRGLGENGSKPACCAAGHF